MNLFNGQVLYDTITYGELIAHINVEALALCTDLKVKAKLQNVLA